MRKLRVLFDANNNWQFVPYRFRELMEKRFDCTFLEHVHLNDAIRTWTAKWADAIFVDWALEWANFYLESFPEKRIIIRTHRADVWHEESPFYAWENADAILFMNNYWRKVFLEEARKNLLDEIEERCFTVPRLVDEKHWRFLHDLTGERKFGKRIGMLGRIAPWKGCLELARLMEKDLEDFSLSLKGLCDLDIKLHGEYVEAIRKLDGKIEVVEHSVGDSVVKWFADVDFIVSNSTVESWHAAVTEGMLCGCVPLVRNWRGAEEIYPTEFIFGDLSEAVEKLKQIAEMSVKERKSLSENMRRWCIQRYSLEKVAHLYGDIIEGKSVPKDVEPKNIIGERRSD